MICPFLIAYQAFLELSNEEEARSMVSFYNSNVLPSVCGKPVKIYHSQTYATIQVRFCPSPNLSNNFQHLQVKTPTEYFSPQSGKVIYVGQIPYFKSSDATLLKISEPFGKIRRYYMNRSRNEVIWALDSLFQKGRLRSSSPITYVIEL